MAKTTSPPTPLLGGEGRINAEVLPPEVAAEYEMREGCMAIFADSEFGYVDLRQINLDFARLLEARGYLKKLRQPAGQ